MFLKVMAAYEVRINSTICDRSFLTGRIQVLKDKERRQFYASSNMRGLEDLFGGDSVFAEGREKDLQAFMARYSKKYQHILDEFEVMLRENEHIKQQVRLIIIHTLPDFFFWLLFSRCRIGVKKALSLAGSWRAC